MAYDELAARALVRSRPAAGMYVAAAAGVRAFDPVRLKPDTAYRGLLSRVMHEAHCPARTIGLQDREGNPLYLIV